MISKSQAEDNIQEGPVTVDVYFEREGFTNIPFVNETDNNKIATHPGSTLKTERMDKQNLVFRGEIGEYEIQLRFDTTDKKTSDQLDVEVFKLRPPLKKEKIDIPLSSHHPQPQTNQSGQVYYELNEPTYGLVGKIVIKKRTRQISKTSSFYIA